MKTSLPDSNVPWWKHVNCQCRKQVFAFTEILWVCRGQKFRAQALWSVSSRPPAGPLVLTVSVKERWLQDLLQSACYFASHLLLNWEDWHWKWLGRSRSKDKKEKWNPLWQVSSSPGHHGEATEGEVGPVAGCLLSFPASLLYLLTPPMSTECALGWQLIFFLVIEICFTISPSMFISPALMRVCLESLDHTETISCWRIQPGLENAAAFYTGQSFEKIVSFSASGWVCLC